TTDAANDKSTVWFNELGLVSRTEDARGGISNSRFDPSANLVAYTDVAANSYQYSYDRTGHPTESVNPLGQTVQMTFGALGRLTSVTDAAGHTTYYGYGSTGNLLNITYSGGSQQSFGYDPLGNLSETVLQNGDPVKYQENAQGLLT